jgi:hypothetical protein
MCIAGKDLGGACYAHSKFELRLQARSSFDLMSVTRKRVAHSNKKRPNL